ncbi:MAG: SDR family oxidoreductase [Acetobacteraceae bacterium]
MRGLTGKRVIVTGGASGIGRATCLRLADEGCVVGILDRDEPGATRVAGECTGGKARAYRVDITDEARVEAVVEAFEADAGPIDGLANVAGWDKGAAFLDTDRALWDRIIAINLIGPLNLHKAALRRMAERGFGRVVNVASDAGRVGSSGEAVYSACKGGIIAFTKTMAREMARQGVTLNCLCPGPTETPLFQGFTEDMAGGQKLKDALARAIPLRRLGQPEDYPGLIAFLLSDDAAFITGQTISVSGGLTMA